LKFLYLQDILKYETGLSFIYFVSGSRSFTSRCFTH